MAQVAGSSTSTTSLLRALTSLLRALTSLRIGARSLLLRGTPYSKSTCVALRASSSEIAEENDVVVEEGPLACVAAKGERVWADSVRTCIAFIAQGWREHSAKLEVVWIRREEELNVWILRKHG